MGESIQLAALPVQPRDVPGDALDPALLRADQARPGGDDEDAGHAAGRLYALSRAEASVAESRVPRPAPGCQYRSVTCEPTSPHCLRELRHVHSLCLLRTAGWAGRPCSSCVG